MLKRSVKLILTAAVLAAGLTGAQAEVKKEFNIAWSIDVGGWPGPYAADAGIVKKWGDKYGFKIK